LEGTTLTRILPALASTAAMVWAQQGISSSTAEPVHLTYRAASSCADRSAFIEQIRSRTDRLRDARPDEPARTVEVTLTEVPGGVSGYLRTRTPDGAESERTIQGSSCANVVSALALIVALAVDPEASTAPRRAARPPAQRPPPPARLPPPAPAPTRGPGWGLGFQASVRTAVAPDPLFAIGGYLKLELRSGPLSGGSAKLAVQHGRQTARVVGGSGEIAWTDAHIDGCPWGFQFTRALSLAPCLGFDGGVVTVSGVEDTPNPDSVTRPWLSIGALARGSLSPLRWLALEPELGVGFPLVRDRYYLRPSTTVHDVPFIEFEGGVAIGAVFE
jgi:hypothetical protein